MKIFIGSSEESKENAYKVAEILESIGGVVVEVWDLTKVFIPSRFSLENLENALQNYDGAVFILSGEDMQKVRDKDVLVTRDNVLFEMGLFAGKLGYHNVVAVCTEEKVKLATDLLGYTVIKKYDKNSEYTFRAKLKSWLDNIEPAADITMLSREEIERQSTLEERWKYAKEILIVNFAATSFLASTEVAGETVYRPEFTKIMKAKLKEGVKFQFLLTQPGTFADYDASKNKMKVITNANIVPYDAITLAINKLNKLCRTLSKEEKKLVSYRLTDVALPYAAILVNNDDAHAQFNNIKVDLYSPYLDNDRARRSFILAPTNANYDFFLGNITQLWNNGYSNRTENIHKASIKQLMDSYKDKGKTFAYELKQYNEEETIDKLCNRYSTVFIYLIEGEAFFKVEGKETIFLNDKNENILIIPRNAEYSYTIGKGAKLVKIISGNLYFRRENEWINM